jgi:hypothetical protein
MVFGFLRGQCQLDSCLALSISACLCVNNVVVTLFPNQNTFFEKACIKLPFIIYMSWICVATIANLSALLVSLSWDGGILSPVSWTITMITIACVLGVFIVGRYREPAFFLVLIWAFFGIYSKWTGTENNSIATTALAELILLAILFLVFLIGLKKKATQ